MDLRLRRFQRDDAPALLAFCDDHPYGSWAESLRARLLTTLPSGPSCVLDVFDGDARLLVAVAIDTLASPSDVVRLDVIGSRLSPPAEAVELILRAAASGARAAGRMQVHSGWVHPLTPEVAATLAQNGQRLHEVDLRMRCAAEPARTSRSLPEGWAWREVDESNESAFRRLMLRAFEHAGVSLLVPAPEEWRCSLLAASPRAIALTDGETVIAAMTLRHDPASRVGEIAVLARDPSHRGRGIGERLVREGCRVLADRGARWIELGVSAANERGLDLYRRCGFVVTAESATYAGAADAIRPRR